MDRRGRRSQQGECQHPYENQPFARAFFLEFFPEKRDFFQKKLSFSTFLLNVYKIQRCYVLFVGEYAHYFRE